ncbi:phosphoribosyltransferase family protein [Aliiglaciecola sp. LCG003]|uniref:phosphoribosyltransferase n=1 Tax=Aliiglaciecola sp. LCG003 TaxID=3053655 RepID=UPI0025733C8B|nr:phosphoribosyltransferase family protein [Aliiglaciecola sp. LCG003]WJG09168.1 phosphoribosyltransferase family protein [Aliiglaciecola sp. LCG003]
MAKQLMSHAGRPDTLVLALPRGGLPVAFEVAQALTAPLDIILVRKISAPYQSELAIGAVAEGGIFFANSSLIESLGVSERELNHQKRLAEDELSRRTKLYRGRSTAPDIHDKVVILVDDGLATGATMLAAISSLKLQLARQIVIAVPVASDSALQQVEKQVDEVICLAVPEMFQAVGNWYQSFPQLNDEQVLSYLTRRSS